MSSPFDVQYDDIRNKIITYASQYGIDPIIGIWQLWFENRFRSSGCSGAGACGIAQFTAPTAARFGVDRNNIDSSLNGWGKYMAWLLRQSYIHGDYSLALAGYNAGEGAVQQYGGIPPYSETQNYVSEIMTAAGGQSHSIVDISGLDLSGNSVDYSSGSDTDYALIGGAFLIFLLLLRD